MLCGVIKAKAMSVLKKLFMSIEISIFELSKSFHDLGKRCFDELKTSFHNLEMILNILHVM